MPTTLFYVGPSLKIKIFFAIRYMRGMFRYFNEAKGLFLPIIGISHRKPTFSTNVYVTLYDGSKNLIYKENVDDPCLDIS